MAANSSFTWEVDLSYVEDWIYGLSDDHYDLVLAALEFLAEGGPATGRPFVDSIEHSRHSNMKELRPRGTHIRILFAFDPRRVAIMLITGDKTGQWDKWYRKNIPRADELYDKHLKKLA